MAVDPAPPGDARAGPACRDGGSGERRGPATTETDIDRAGAVRQLDLYRLRRIEGDSHDEALCRVVEWVREGTWETFSECRD